MIIKNNNAKQLTVLLNGKKYVFNAGESMEVSDVDGSFILRIQPLLCAVKETVEIHSEPVKIEPPVVEEPKAEKPKAKKNVKNKKSGK